MSRDDIKRYIEQEVPGIGILENRPATVRCYRDGCKSAVEVDPETLVVEDDEAVEVQSEECDAKNPMETTGRTSVEIYCSTDCRNQHYNARMEAD